MDERSLPPFAVRKSWIFSVFLIIPLVALFGGWDFYLNNQQLLPHLRYDSLFLPLYLLIFELPHVIASFFSFCQKEYVRHYRYHLFVGVPLVLLFFFFLIDFNFVLAVVTYLVVTIFHVVRQQTGISHFFGVPKNRWHWWWSWFLIIGLASMYIIMQPQFVPVELQSKLMLLVQIVLVLSALVGVRLALQAKSKLGAFYVYVAILMSLVSYLMLAAGYEFLSVLVVRVIHDVTAFLFYVNHEMNNNHTVVKNLLYKHIPFLPWSLVLFVPLTAIGLGLLLRNFITDVQILFTIVMTVSFIHYYLESVIWKRNSLHRGNIHIS